MEGDNRESLTNNNNKKFERCSSYAGDELRSFRTCLRWMCVDAQNHLVSSLISWSVFVLLSVVVPAVSHFVLSYNVRRRSFDSVVQLSLSAVSALSFITLSGFVRRYGLRKVLFIDKLCGESDMVRDCYIQQLHRSFKLLLCFVVPCFFSECAYKVYWYCSGERRIPFLGNPYASDAVACLLELWSWLYRASTFFLVCVLFRLICHLQILRLQDFACVFQVESDVALVLKEHLRIRRQLRVISHRFRAFIVSCLTTVTASLFASLLITTRPHAVVNLFTAGELALCSIVLVTGMLVCLRSAAKITHKAQAITSLAAKWHICATMDSFDTDTEAPHACTNRVFPLQIDSDEEEVPDDDDMGDTQVVVPHLNTISFQKRQALVTYLENNRAGITVFGFTVDRAWLHTIFGVELSLVLWLLGKTVGIS
ncbi:hypothetical protein QJS04_geneDACA005190 [Acorus gramineus]|uniref:Uncharacterized protein n=1 Tax=Acorus gramineus TaxID=55184 RepID=A0AAV9AYL4_ACOGR|nr:hypothetical protein QJS04_geneDACA005190 [Acorus gramineus]